MNTVEAGRLDRRIRFERPSRVDDAYGQGDVVWQEVCTVWANVKDQLLFNSAEGGGEVRQRTLPTRVRIRYRDDITTDMRAVLIDRGRTMQLMSISEMGRGDMLEMMCEEFTTAGVG